MRSRLSVWLTGAAVHAMGDRYEGTIAAVVEHEVFNKWKKKTTLEAVVVFTDGKQLVLNRSTQHELIERLGYESDDWIGAPLVIGSRRGGDRTDAKTGEVVETWERILLPRAPGTIISSPQPAWVTERDEPDVSDKIGAHDEDAIEPEASPFVRRRVR